VWWDESFKQGGFGVRVTSQGTGTYYVTYRSGGRFVWYPLGRVGKVGLSTARKEAKSILSRVGVGGDPAQERKDKRAAAEAARAAADFETLCDQFITSREGQGKLAASTAAEYKRMVAAYVQKRPALGKKKAEEVDPKDLDAALEAVAKGGAPVQANRLYQFFNAVMRWARRKQKLLTNPMEAVDRPRKEATRERTLTDPEVALLWRALDRPAQPGETAIPATVAGVVKFLLLLGQRSSETILARWADLRLAARAGDVSRWEIPGEFRKGGLLHVVPLPKPALTLLEGLKPITGREARIFDGVTTQNEERDWWGVVRARMLADAERAEIRVAHFTKHDLRRTCFTGMTGLGVTRFIADRVVGHKETGIGAVYDRNAYLGEKAAALAAWAARVEAVAAGEDRKADVLPMVRGKRRKRAS
jgi:integrase